MRLPSTLNHFVPLTPDGERYASLTLPTDVTRSEVERLTAFLAALASRPDPATDTAAPGEGSDR